MNQTARSDQRQPQREEQRLTRVTRSEDRFAIDPSRIPDGMVYQWNAETVMGKTMMDISPEIALDLAQNHWRPVPAGRHPEISGAKSRDSTEQIVRGGLVLCERPRYLNDEAHQEERLKASRQKRDQLHQLRESAAGTLPRTKSDGTSLVKVSHSVERGAAPE